MRINSELLENGEIIEWAYIPSHKILVDGCFLLSFPAATKRIRTCSGLQYGVRLGQICAMCTSALITIISDIQPLKDAAEYSISENQQYH